MKKILSVLTMFIMLASVGFVAAGPSAEIPLIVGNTPIYTEGDFAPLVFLNEQRSGRILFNDLYFNNGDITKRVNNYAFTGEQIQWTVLVWDKNGMPEKIRDVWAGWASQTNGPVSPEAQVNCQYIQGVSGNLAEQGYSNVRRPGDQEAQVNGNPETMGEYLCTLTIEPTCHGQKWFGVTAEDLDGNKGDMHEAESWFCNPSLSLTISGNVSFGELGSGEQGSSTISIKNAGETNSGVEVVLAIAGKDFYDPSSSGAMCPTTNALKLQGVEGATQPFKTGFWYKAVMGSKTTGYKRIPYLTNYGIQSADPVFSTSNGMTAKWNEPLTAMSPGAETSMTLYLGIPQPCNGQFTDGTISLFAWAI